MKSKSLKKIIVCLFILTSIFKLFADEPREQPAVVWLMIEPGAKASGMGEAYVAIADDATASFWNPAGMAFIKKRELSLMHSNWLPQLTDDLYYEYFGFVNEIKDLGGLGGNITFMSEGEQTETNERGEELGKFWTYEGAITAAFGTQVMKNMGVGIGVKFIYSHLYHKASGTGIGFGVDLGYLHKLPGEMFPSFMHKFTKEISYGVCLQNLGPNIVYSDAENSSPIPTNLKIGIAYKFLEDNIFELKGVFDYNKSLVGIQEGLMDELKLGIENFGFDFTYYKLLSVRLGYINDSEGRIQGMTYGMGVRYNIKKKIDMRFDFAGVYAGEFATGNILEKTNKKFSFSLNF
ncbi:MAG: PorV/PorQ family protein [Candidatus Coatesbacteria bacterium]|nr:PorV/PorQ family protein [Candidatus Coatesbacteria bacterium]